MVLVKATVDSEQGLLPSAELLAAMGRFNEELIKAGMLLAGDGLKPSAQGRRVAGFWLWEVKDMDDAIAWVKRCPNPMPGPSEIEIRPLYELADFA